jgi:hypothetical protein
MVCVHCLPRQKRRVGGARHKWAGRHLPVAVASMSGTRSGSVHWRAATVDTGMQSKRGSAQGSALARDVVTGRTGTAHLGGLGRGQDIAAGQPQQTRSGQRALARARTHDGEDFGWVGRAISILGDGSKWPVACRLDCKPGRTSQVGRAQLVSSLFHCIFQ